MTDKRLTKPQKIFLGLYNKQKELHELWLAMYHNNNPQWHGEYNNWLKAWEEAARYSQNLQRQEQDYD